MLRFVERRVSDLHGDEFKDCIDESLNERETVKSGKMKFNYARLTRQIIELETGLN